VKAHLMHFAGTFAGWAALSVGHLAVRYPWPAAVVALLAVIFVLRRLPRGSSGSSSSAPSPSVVVPGVAIAGMAVAAAIWFTRSHAAPAVATAPVPTPTITQKVLHPVIVQHITHVTAQSHTGLYVLIGIIVFLLVGMVLRLNSEREG
jgi:hypothetical protein